MRLCGTQPVAGWHARAFPAHLIAGWLGHTDASFTFKTYVHARPEDLVEARDALSRVKSA